RQLGMLSREPAGEHGLGERWAVIGQIGLIPDEGERAGEALGAQRLRGAEPSERGADDHNAPALEEGGPGSLESKAPCAVAVMAVMAVMAVVAVLAIVRNVARHAAPPSAPCAWCAASDAGGALAPTLPQ